MIRVLLPRKRPKWQLAVPAILFLCAFALPGAMLLLEQGNPSFNNLDIAWHGFSAGLHSPLWDSVNAVLNWAGYTGMVLFHILLAGTLIVWQRPLSAAFSAMAGLVVLGVTQLAKGWIGRVRPQDANVLTDTGSYPSGHVSATTTFLLVVALLVGRRWVMALAVLGILAMMISRTYLAAHWLSDVWGGACLAAGLVLLMWLPFQEICVRENTNAVRMTR